VVAGAGTGTKSRQGAGQKMERRTPEMGEDTMSFLFEIGRETLAQAPRQAVAHASWQASSQAAAQPHSAREKSPASRSR